MEQINSNSTSKECKNNITKYLCETIYYLCSVKKIRIGDLEKELGVSIGYFSRIKNSTGISGNKCISVDLCVHIADLLEVKIEDLLDPLYIVKLVEIEKNQKMNKIKEMLEKTESEYNEKIDVLMAKDRSSHE